MTKRYDVVVVGAGPVGCFLARELRLGGASVLVLEAERERSPHSKALTMNARSIELLDLRGLADRFLREGVTMPTAHFAALPTRLALAPLDSRHPYTLVLPQRRTEELLEEAARELGVELRFGHRFHALEETADGLSVEVEHDGARFHVETRFVVGCDGARSAVREAAKIDFPGTTTTMTAFQADARLGAVDVPPGVMNEHGGLMLVRQAGGVHRVVVTDPTRAHVPRDVAPTTEELRDSMMRIAGTDFGLHETLWLARFGNATRQAATYRKGAVFLAGDAAHVHFPAGGQGMNVGLQDAANLGWRLALAVRGVSQHLDDYHVERHPVGAEVLENTRAQEGLLGFSPQHLALRSWLSGVLRDPRLNRELAEQVTGLGVAYPVADAHSWVGRRLPDVELADGTRAFESFRRGRFVCLAEAPGVFDDLPVEARRADVRGLRPGLEDARALWVRPDGHVGAVLGEEDDARAVATRWLATR